jgi:hypothetical protein
MVFRDFVSQLLATQGIEVPDKTVPLWLVKAVATIGDGLAALTGGHLRLPVSRQDLAIMAVDVTLDTDRHSGASAIGQSLTLRRACGKWFPWLGAKSPNNLTLAKA